ncbi:hypothetical protein AVL56_12020 [Alteromonas stellipolaris]|uniref:Uncharacterized protein n=1 Tax=Alteromonas stellipolaris TaxID=233316 RepID=A0ABM5YKA9_9ALTE|nr:hypothetical protein AVL57_12895 [Alteromonas stellipolaris]AMJ87178.1 hypothetical protein AV939_11735 [Alteromonas sp. Mac1]AMJ91040.1 hypothetical protein AV940_11500 [Alteromonas sp. Mac2]AMJ94950.1 hypothetical protein AVL56_12020 [Alteromonas stellipolaris]ANB22095.1 hypothetical protein A6K25_12920 [Alteromonas stellipolaris]
MVLNDYCTLQIKESLAYCIAHCVPNFVLLSNYGAEYTQQWIGRKPDKGCKTKVVKWMGKYYMLLRKNGISKKEANNAFLLNTGCYCRNIR